MFELLRKNFQLAMVVFLSSSAILAIAPFIVVRILAADYFMAALDSLVVLGMGGLLVLAIKSGQVRLCSILIATFYTLGAILAIYFRFESTLYWIYPIAIANFFVLPIRMAMALNGLIVLALIPLFPQFSSHFEFLVVIISLMLVTALTSIFSWKTESQRQELELQAMRDPLTGLHNRRSLNDVASAAIAHCQREGEPSSIILMDLDHFKVVNDVHGHEAGDKILCDLAQLLMETTRAGSDTVFRFGGEEFLVVVNQCRLEQAIRMAEKMRTVIRQQLHSPDGPITASFGCAELAAGEDQDQWIKRADDALYEAKKAGRNCVRPSLEQARSGGVDHRAATSTTL